MDARVRMYVPQRGCLSTEEGTSCGCDRHGLGQFIDGYFRHRAVAVPVRASNNGWVLSVVLAFNLGVHERKLDVTETWIRFHIIARR
jgi:hypothetical protein